MKVSSLRQRMIIRQGLQSLALGFLIFLGWKSISGAFSQIQRSKKMGQKIETLIQVAFGALSLLVFFTHFWQKRFAKPIQTIWSVVFTIIAGLSSVVWGPKMAHISILFVAISLLLSKTIIYILRLTLKNNL